MAKVYVKRELVLRACDRALEAVEDLRNKDINGIIDRYAALQRQSFWGRLFRRKYVPLTREELLEVIKKYDSEYPKLATRWDDIELAAKKYKVMAEVSDREVICVDFNELGPMYMAFSDLK